MITADFFQATIESKVNNHSEGSLCTLTFYNSEKSHNLDFNDHLNNYYGISNSNYNYHENIYNFSDLTPEIKIQMPIIWQAENGNDKGETTSYYEINSRMDFVDADIQTRIYKELFSSGGSTSEIDLVGSNTVATDDDSKGQHFYINYLTDLSEVYLSECSSEVDNELPNEETSWINKENVTV